MKDFALFVIFEKAAKFEIVICCKLLVVLYGLLYYLINVISDLNCCNNKVFLYHMRLRLGVI